MSGDVKHTPGPWSVCHDGDCRCGFIWSACGEVHVASAHDETVLGRSWYGSDVAVNAETRKANSLLIAAAPDMLRALEIISLNLGLTGKPNERELDELHRIAIDAVTKATVPHSIPVSA